CFGDLLVLFSRTLYWAMAHRRVAADPGRRIPLGTGDLHIVRSRVLLRDHARRHPVDPTRPGPGGTGARHVLLVGDGGGHPAPGLPQHGAGAADANPYFVSGYIVGLRDLDHRMPWLRVQGRPARRTAG